MQFSALDSRSSVEGGDHGWRVGEKGRRKGGEEPWKRLGVGRLRLEHLADERVAVVECRDRIHALLRDYVLALDGSLWMGAARG